MGTSNNPNQPPVDQPPQWLQLLNGLRSDLEDHVVERHRHRLPALVERLDEFEADLTSDLYDRINALETKKNQMKRKLRKLHLTA